MGGGDAPVEPARPADQTTDADGSTPERAAAPAAAISPPRPAKPAALESLEDGPLMERYRDGEPAAFGILLRRHQGPVFRFLLRHVGDPTAAEDLTQETFMRVVNGRASFQSGARFTTWLYTIARNLSVDELRRRSYRRHPSLDAPLGSRDGGEGRTLGDLMKDQGPSTEARAADGEVRVALEQALAKLPQEQREVFTLREMGGLSFQEIAGVVGCNENTAKSRMRYALERLHAALLPLQPEDEG